MASEEQPENRYTYRDYCKWPDDQRVELIDGTAFAMSPAPNRKHQEVVGELFLQIGSYLRGRKCRSYIAPFDVRLALGREPDEDIDTVVQPDISVVCDPDKLDDKGCRGAPDWIIEVLSPNTASKDHIEKREIYERHGVRDYWLVHPVDHIVTIYTLVEGKYGRAAIHETKGTLTVGLLPGLEIDWDLVFPSDTE